MTYRAWAAQPFDDGEHRITDWPVDVLHPLRHGQVALRMAVCDGIVRACTLEVGANHRGDERLLEVRDLRQGLALVNRHGWLTAAHAETLYARLAETQLGITPSPRALALRDLTMAITDAATEALWAYVTTALDGPADPRLLDARERHLTALEALTGARMHVTYARIGGVAADIDPTLLATLLEHPADAGIAAAAAAVRAADGPLAVSLPKVVRLPVGDAYGEITTPHGTLGMWLVGRGDRVPHRVHLRTPGFRALAALETQAPGMAPAALLWAIATTRFAPGEVSR